ncbi:Tyrosine transporter [Operophtera brumata]|uniref:Tyrosine transporter n=1 Tax=Operophtera brumata TaxID=104452 RepID=A0A0L7KYL9_OPEBR|nr:Tyrosine transporter [Operophtera brumata]
MTLLLACWLFFTSVFLMYNEKETIVRNSAVAPGEVKRPFLSVTNEARLNGTDFKAAKKMEKTDSWSIILQDETLDFSEGEPRQSTLTLEPYLNSTGSTYMLRLQTSSDQTAPFAMSLTINPLDVSTGVIYACLLLSLATLSIAGERPTLPELISWLDMETLLLLFSMMLLVSIMAETGILWPLIGVLCAITAVLSTVLDNVTTVLLMTPVTISLWPLIGVLCAITVVLSTVLDNVTTVLLMTPVTISLWPLIGVLCAITVVLSTVLDNVTTVLLMTPVTISLWPLIGVLCAITAVLSTVLDNVTTVLLMTPASISNIGGTATPVGDPPNVIIASNKAVVQAVSTHCPVLLCMCCSTSHRHALCVQTWIQLRYFIYRDTDKLRLNESRDIQELRQQISIWRRAAESLPHMSRDEHVVRERLERKVRKLSIQLDVLVSGLTSAFVDNIPLTTMMVRIVTSLGSNPALNLPMTPLIWALSFGACLGGKSLHLPLHFIIWEAKIIINEHKYL